MKIRRSHLTSSIRWMLVLPFMLLPMLAAAQWNAAVGAQSTSLGTQALAFLPNEIWIHAGQNITWTFNVDEIHTVTFLTDGQVRPPFQVGCPGFATGSDSFDGSTCVTTPPLVKGQTFTVTFPKAGNFRLVCLVHPNMTGVVHVLDPALPLPHAQHFYDVEGLRERIQLLSDTDPSTQHPNHNSPHSVTAGIGEVVATGGGTQSLSIMRFMDPVITIHAGQTVEWTNYDAVTPHTITFGVEPANPLPPVNATPDPDGALHGTINSPADSVHSGFIGAPPQDEMFLPSPPLVVTRFRVTFTQPGVYPYICALHDELGMKGEVIVLP
jgi:plastocyanin